MIAFEPETPSEPRGVLIQGEPVVLSTPAGMHLLLDRHRRSCRHCTAGVRVITLWASLDREGLRITWCRTCFNAETGPTPLDPALDARLALLAHRLRETRPPRTWACARPALEALEAGNCDG